jgi:hypothetical protein
MNTPKYFQHEFQTESGALEFLKLKELDGATKTKVTCVHGIYVAKWLEFTSD